MLKTETFVLNAFLENTFIIWDDIQKEAVIIDPGCSNSAEEKLIGGFIKDNGLKLKYLFNTHCHIDHILGNSFIKSEFNPEFLAGEEDVFLLELMEHQARNYGMQMKKSPVPDSFFSDNQSLYLAGHEIVPIFTPGHSPGEFSLYFKGNNFCVTGDVLFQEGIGRTDLWGGDYDKLIESIENRLFSLPDDTIIYPGHGSSSTILHEKTNNPFLN
ncbi:MAG: MBL fold metallo-hydrolase [Syntrophothermus sp.]